MIHKSSDVDEVEVSECLGTYVSSAVKRQKISVGLGQNLLKLMVEQQAKHCQI